jgi:hypothetical protein
MQRGEYGPWNRHVPRNPAVACEPTVVAGEGSYSALYKISRNNPMSYSHQRYTGDRSIPYPREAALLTLAKDRSLTQENLWFPDLVFANAYYGSRILEDKISPDFTRLKHHIRRGVCDIPKEELPMLSTSEARLYKYAAGGDALLLEYCDRLNHEVGVSLLWLLVSTNKDSLLERLVVRPP